MASYEVVNNVGIITCQNPPVNALSYHLRKDFINGVQSALSDSNVKAIVIIADGKTFIAGADITEFSKPPKPDASVTDMLDILDKSPKPTIAAIHGTGLLANPSIHALIQTNKQTNQRLVEDSKWR